mgnify:CR=1 FL=1
MCQELSSEAIHNKNIYIYIYIVLYIVVHAQMGSVQLMLETLEAQQASVRQLIVYL